MSAAQAEDQLAAIRQARELQEQILARRGGIPLPSSGDDLNELREERTVKTFEVTEAMAPFG